MWYDTPILTQATGFGAFDLGCGGRRQFDRRDHPDGDGIWLGGVSDDGAALLL